MFGYMTFLKNKNKTRIKIIQKVFMRRQVKLHFRTSNANNTVISLKYPFLLRFLWRFAVQYKLSQSSFSSTIGIFIIDMNDICYYNTFHSNVTNNSNQGISQAWSYCIWIYNYLCTQCLSSLTLFCSNPVHGEVQSIQHYVIKFVSVLWQVGCFLRVLWFPPLIKLTATI